MSEWTISKHTVVDKRFYINTPDENFRLIVDNDDVVCQMADIMAEAMVEVLNTHWPEVEQEVMAKMHLIQAAWDDEGEES